MKKTSIPPLTTVMNKTVLNENELFIGPPQDQIPDHKAPSLPAIASGTLKLFGRQEQTYSLKRPSAPSSLRANKFQYRQQSPMSK